MKKTTAVILALAGVVALIVIALVARDDSPVARDDLPQGAEAGAVATSGTTASVPFGPDTFRRIAAAQMPMVVNIRTESRRQTRDLSEFFDGDGLLERFFGFPNTSPRARQEITQAAGSGFVIDDDGLILTNNHVVEGATRITVALYSARHDEEREYSARVVGRDPLTDSALIELTEEPSHDLSHAAFGNSDDMRPGDWVVAIGNPFNLAHTVTAGVISAVGRPFPVSEGRWQNVLQTDAAINPGNSGGPLLNLRGEVVGMNTAIISGGVGNVGVGFAIPINTVRDLLPELRRGSITRGRIGVQISPVTADLVKPLGLDDANGALIRLVERDGPAAAAGIEPGDVIVRFNGNAVDDSDDLVKMVTRTEPGTTVPVEIVRGGEHRTLRVEVARLEMAGAARAEGPVADSGLGVTLRNLTPAIRSQLQLPSGRSGALVETVQPGSAAASAGIRAGDVILEVNRKPVGSAAEAAGGLRSIAEGATGFALLWRDGQEQFVTLTRR